MNRPNILFAIADDASHMSAYGYDFVNTPNFDYVANNGVLFENSFTTNPKCSPSRASILTGMHTWQLEDACIHYSSFSSKFAVYPTILEDNGYNIGYTGKGWAPGNYEIGGFKHNPAGPEYNDHHLMPPENSHVSSIDYTKNFENFLDKNGTDKPFCFWYGGLEPHRPYIKGEGRRAGKDPSTIKVPPYLPDDDIVKSDLADYAYEIEYFDMHLGNMIRILEQRGMLSNTLIVALSDNGMPFPRVKGQMYEQDFHLPLAMCWQGKVKGGRRISDLVSFADLAPTFLDVAGIKKHPQMAGKSLFEILMSDKSGAIDYDRRYVYMAKERHDVGREYDVGYPVRCIRDYKYLYIRNYCPDRWPAGDPRTKFTNVDPSPTKKLIIDLKLMDKDYYFDLSFGKRPAEELYDIESDPVCMNNLIENAELAQVKERLSKDLDKELKRTNDPRFFGKADFFDKCEYYGEGHHRWIHYVNGDFEYPDE